MKALSMVIASHAIDTVIASHAMLCIDAGHVIYRLKTCYVTIWYI